MRFKDFPGQNKAKGLLERMLELNRLPHALLFSGPSSVGKLGIAMALAARVLCENPNEEGACLECNQCRKVTQLIHPDLHFSFPVVGAKNLSDHFIKEFRSSVLENPYITYNQWLAVLGADNKQGNITYNLITNKDILHTP